MKNTLLKRYKQKLKLIERMRTDKFRALATTDAIVSWIEIERAGLGGKSRFWQFRRGWRHKLVKQLATQWSQWTPIKKIQNELRSMI